MAGITVLINGQPIIEIKKGHPDVITDDDNEGWRSLLQYDMRLYSGDKRIYPKEGDVVEFGDGTKYVCVDDGEQRFQKVVK